MLTSTDALKWTKKEYSTQVICTTFMESPFYTKGPGILHFQHSAPSHSWVGKPFKVFSFGREHRKTHSARVHYLVDFVFMRSRHSHMHCCAWTQKTAAREQCSRTPVDHPNDENHITRTVCRPPAECGWPKYTLRLTPPTIIWLSQTKLQKKSRW